MTPSRSVRSVIRPIAVVCLIASGMASCSLVQRITAPKRRVFVSNYQDDTISVINDETGKEIKVIPVGDSPFGLAVRSEPPLLAVANSSGTHVTLIDPVRLEILRTIEVGEIPEHLVFSVDGKLLFVSRPKARAVEIVDVDAARVVGTIDLGLKPKRLAVSPDGHRLYVLLNVQDGAVAVVDIASRAVIAKVPVGAFPNDFGITRDGRRIVAASFNDDTVTVVDTETLKPIATHEVDTGVGIVVHPTQPIVYSMATFDDVVHVLNYETGRPVAEITTGTWPTYSAITADGRFLWVVDENSNNVAKVDTETNESVERIGVGLDPQNAAVLEIR